MRCCLALLVLTLGVGCEPGPAITADNPGADTTVTDALGRTLTVAAPPRRVLPLAPNLTEIAFAVGAGPRVAAVSPADDHPEAIAGLPRFSTYPLDHEGVVALEPDLLLATDQVNSPAEAAPFEALGIPTYFFSFASVADVPAALRTAGRLLGGDGEPAARAFESAVGHVRDAVAGLPRPRTLLLVGDDVLYAFGRDSYASEAVRLAGGDNLTDGFEGQAVTLSDEWVLEQQPDVIVVLSDPYDPASLLAHHPTWRGLPAVRAGRVVGLDPDLLSRPGPRLADGIQALAQRLHPAAPLAR
ncbi:MAG: ABC transporter substrate-binding protein [Rubricoccaceae bacterium]|nr:ABC transporter substrate-binding protein [Rubricoccaceae bacterium]